jgi:hypothetical protein
VGRVAIPSPAVKTPLAGGEGEAQCGREVRARRRCLAWVRCLDLGCQLRCCRGFCVWSRSFWRPVPLRSNLVVGSSVVVGVSPLAHGQGPPSGAVVACKSCEKAMACWTGRNPYCGGLVRGEAVISVARPSVEEQGPRVVKGFVALWGWAAELLCGCVASVPVGSDCDVDATGGELCVDGPGLQLAEASAAMSVREVVP